MKPTKKQLNSIKNAETKDEAWEAYDAIVGPARKACDVINESYKAINEAYKVIRNHAFEVYEEIQKPACEVYRNWQAPNLNYESMTKKELIELLKRKDEE